MADDACLHNCPLNPIPTYPMIQPTNRRRVPVATELSRTVNCCDVLEDLRKEYTYPMFRRSRRRTKDLATISRFENALPHTGRTRTSKRTTERPRSPTSDIHFPLSHGRKAINTKRRHPMLSPSDPKTHKMVTDSSMPRLLSGHGSPLKSPQFRSREHNTGLHSFITLQVNEKDTGGEEKKTQERGGGDKV